MKIKDIPNLAKVRDIRKDIALTLKKKIELGPVGGERTDRDKKIDEFMANYTSQFRRKSLLEEHQVRNFEFEEFSKLSTIGEKEGWSSS